MADAFKNWHDVARRVNDHDTAIKALQRNDERQDRELAGINKDIGLLGDVVFRAKKRGKAAAQRANRKRAKLDKRTKATS